MISPLISSTWLTYTPMITTVKKSSLIGESQSEKKSAARASVIKYLCQKFPNASLFGIGISYKEHVSKKVLLRLLKSQMSKKKIGNN